MALFPGPSICITNAEDYSKRYFHDNVLHVSLSQWNQPGQKLEYICHRNIWYEKCIITCPVWSLALAANSITYSAKVRRPWSKTTAFEPIHCNPRRGQPSQAKPSREHNKTVCIFLGTYCMAKRLYFQGLGASSSGFLQALLRVKSTLYGSGNKVWWLYLVLTSTTRFTSDVGYRMAKI